MTITRRSLQKSRTRLQSSHHSAMLAIATPPAIREFRAEQEQRWLWEMHDRSTGDSEQISHTYAPMMENR